MVVRLSPWMWEKTPDGFNRLGESLPLAGDPMSRTALESGRSLLERLSDRGLDPASRAVLDERGEKSRLTIPMQSADGPIGLLIFWDREGARAFSREELALASALAGLAGEAVRGAKLLGRLDRRMGCGQCDTPELSTACGTAPDAERRGDEAVLGDELVAFLAIEVEDQVHAPLSSPSIELLPGELLGRPVPARDGQVEPVDLGLVAWLIGSTDSTHWADPPCSDLLVEQAVVTGSILHQRTRAQPAWSLARMDGGVRGERGRRPPEACKIGHMDGAHERADARPGAPAWSAGGGGAGS